MLSLAVIGTFYGRHENSLPLMHRLFVDSTRKPDEAWLMCETMEDVDTIGYALSELYEMELLDTRPGNLRLCETPRLDNGSYAVLPYANKINVALDESEADLVVYLDNNSMPSPYKFEAMAKVLEAHPDWGAVYCTQKRTGFNETIFYADNPVEDGYCALNYTQVMHRRTNDRWPTDMDLADPDLADGVFWRTLHASLGPFFPAGGSEVHDEHHIPSPKATLL